MYMPLCYKTGANVHEILHRRDFTCKKYSFCSSEILCSSPKPSPPLNVRMAEYPQTVYVKNVFRGNLAREYDLNTILPLAFIPSSFFFSFCSALSSIPWEIFLFKIELLRFSVVVGGGTEVGVELLEVGAPSPIAPLEAGEPAVEARSR